MTDITNPKDGGPASALTVVKNALTYFYRALEDADADEDELFASALSRLSELEKAEPVAWLPECGSPTVDKAVADGWRKHGGKVIPLYTHPAAAPQVPTATAILQAVARGWCHEKTSDREMDPELALAISAEVFDLLSAAPKEPTHSDGVGAPRTDHIRQVPGGAAFLRVAADGVRGKSGAPGDSVLRGSNCHVIADPPGASRNSMATADGVGPSAKSEGRGA